MTKTKHETFSTRSGGEKPRLQYAGKRGTAVSAALMHAAATGLIDRRFLEHASLFARRNRAQGQTKRAVNNYIGDDPSQLPIKPNAARKDERIA